MKSFAYTMRDKTGALQSGSLQAHDRQEALQKIRAMGGTPVSVTEGSAPKAPFAWQPAWTRVACILGAGVVLIVGVVFWLQRPRTPPRIESQTERPATPVTAPVRTPTPAPVAQTPVQKAKVKEVSAPAAPTALQPAPTVAEEPPAPAVAATPAVHTNRPVGVRLFTKDGKELTNKAPKFTTQTDRFLWGILKNPGGTATTVISPTVIERDFARALEQKIPIEPDDDAETIALKQQLELVKAEIAELVKNGDNLADIIRDIQTEYNDAATIRRQTRQTLFDLIKSGDLETAAEYQAESNKELQSRGIEPVSVPAKLLEKVQKEQRP